MGIESEFRALLKKMAPDCFFPQIQPVTGDFVFPKITSDFGGIDDVNSRVRSYPLLYPGCKNPTPYALRTWGAVMHRIAADYADIFAAGILHMRCMLDYNSPPNKGHQHEKRSKSAGDKLKRQRSDADLAETSENAAGADPRDSYYKWPENEDGSEWFLPETPCQCSWEEIYYNKDPRAKRLWVQALTKFILHDMPLLPQCSLLLDCGVLNGKWIRRPAVVSFVHPFGSRAAVTPQDLLDASEDEPASVTRWVRPMLEHPKTFWSYCEADDRLAYHVYDLAIRERKSVIVWSGDGDTTISLINTFRERQRIQRNLSGDCPREFRVPDDQKLPMVLHAMKRHRRSVYLNGLTSNHTDTVMIDVDRLATSVAAHWGGHAMSAILRKGLPPVIPNGNVLFTLLVCMRDTDYSCKYPFLTSYNILETFELRPDLLAKAVVCEEQSDPERMGVFRYLDIRIRVSAFVEWIREAALVSKENYKGTRCRPPSAEVTQPKSAQAKKRKAEGDGGEGPAPSDDDRRMTVAGVMAMAMRVVWTADKFINGGLPGYRLANPFERDPTSGLPLYGYEEIQDPATKAKKVIFSFEAHPREVARIVRY